MSRRIVGRILQTLPLLLLVTFASFGLSVAAPVDPARMALGAGGTGVQPDERDVAAKRAQLGLDRPLWERYARWWSDAVRLDFGRSFASNRSVAELFGQRLPASASLALLAVWLSTVIGMPLGLLVAARPRTLLDRLTRMIVLLTGSVPGFVLALLAMWLFAAQLHWVPALGSFTPGGIVLPAIVLAVRPIGRLLRLLRSTALDVLTREFVSVARAKGLGEMVVLTRHVLPNALLPALAAIGLDFTALFANAAVIEWVFAWPGIGRLGVDAALAADVPVLMAFVLVVGWMVVLVNLLVDIASDLVDPRQRAPANSLG